MSPSLARSCIRRTYKFVFSLVLCSHSGRKKKKYYSLLIESRNKIQYTLSIEFSSLRYSYHCCLVRNLNCPDFNDLLIIVTQKHSVHIRKFGHLLDSLLSVTPQLHSSKLWIRRGSWQVIMKPVMREFGDQTQVFGQSR